MSDLVAIVYPSESKAEEVRQRLLKLQKEYLITLSDAVIAVKTDSGDIKLNQLVNTTARGAVSGSFWGLLACCSSPRSWASRWAPPPARSAVRLPTSVSTILS